jgi:hypothetical protein
MMVSVSAAAAAVFDYQKHRVKKLKQQGDT